MAQSWAAAGARCRLWPVESFQAFAVGAPCAGSNLRSSLAAEMADWWRVKERKAHALALWGELAGYSRVVPRGRLAQM